MTLMVICNLIIYLNRRRIGLEERDDRKTCHDKGKEREETGAPCTIQSSVLQHQSLLVRQRLKVQDRKSESSTKSQ